MTETNLNKKVNLDTADQHKSFNEKIDEIRQLTEENLRYVKYLKNREEKIEKDFESQKELQKLLQENLKVSKKLYKMTKKISSWVTWQRVFGVIKILIILIPVLLGLIYLPPLIRESVKPFYESYSQIINFGKETVEVENLILPNTD